MSSRETAELLLPQDSPHHPLGPWFPSFRAERAARRLEAGPRRPRAVVTMVYNEAVFLPIWLAWYSQWYEPDEIFVLDNDSTDGSTDREGFVRIPVTRGAVDHEWMVRTLQGFQHDLLARGFHSVLVTEVDEIIAPVPEWGTFGDYLDGFGEPWVNPLGYEILHQRGSEPPIDLARPILDQRAHWYLNDGYSKPVLATVPMHWALGMHGTDDHALKPDPDLRLIHLHRMDFDLCLERHRTRSRRPWADEDDEKGWGTHNRITDEEAFARWFETDSGFPLHTIQVEPIRATWRGLI